MDAHTTQALALSLLLSASVPLLPPGWQIARDLATGKFYFYNTTTGVVQWEPPGIGAAAAAANAAAATGENGEILVGGPGSAAGALMGAGKRRMEDGTPAMSAAGVLLAGAGGVGGSHHSEKRARLGEGRQSDFEEEVVGKLTAWCGEPTTWNTKKKVIESFKTSPMWVSWVKAGHNEQKLVNFVNRLKIKHLEDGHNKDNGAGVAEFEAEVVEKLNGWCGETSMWNTKKKSIDLFKEAPLWQKWTAAGHNEQKMVNLINRLKIRHTEEAAKGHAAAAMALAIANGTAPPGGMVNIMGVGGVGGVSAFETEVVSQLRSICGEPTLWNTKRKVIDAFKISTMWDNWCTAGHNEQKLVNFINRLKIKHLEEGGGAGTGGGGVSSFEPEVVKQLSNYCGSNASNWNTKKNVMDALKASTLWGSWASTGHTEQQLVNFINRLKMKHLKDDTIPVQLQIPGPNMGGIPGVTSGVITGVVGVGGMATGMHPGMPAAMHPGMAASMHTGMPTSMHTGMGAMPTAMHPGMPTGMHTGMPTGMPTASSMAAAAALYSSAATSSAGAGGMLQVPAEKTLMEEEEEQRVEKEEEEEKIKDAAAKKDFDLKDLDPSKDVLDSSKDYPPHMDVTSEDKIEEPKSAEKMEEEKNKEGAKEEAAAAAAAAMVGREDLMVMMGMGEKDMTEGDGGGGHHQLVVEAPKDMLRVDMQVQGLAQPPPPVDDNL